MAESPNNASQNRFVLVFISIANILLFFSLLNARSNRIAFTEVPFFTGEFIVLFILAIVLIGLSFWAFMNQKVMRWIQRSWIITITLSVIAILGIIILPNIIPVFQNYSAPFLLWIFIVVFALLFILTTPTLQKINIKPLLTTIAQSLIGLLILFAILEGGMRLWFTFLGSETDKANYLYSVDDVVNKYNRFNGQPYVNFGLSPNHPDHNAQGYRGDDFITPKPDGTFRIFAIGGSTTYGVSLTNEQTYPAQLQRILHERGYTQVEVVNAGVPQYATYDNLVNFQFRILDDSPDMIITYEGINDVVTRLVDPAHYTGLNPMRGIWNTSIIAQSPFVSVRFFSQRLGLSTPISSLDSVLFNVGDVLRCTDSQFCQNINLAPQDVLEKNPPIYFERNLRNLVALAKTNNTQVIFSTWAYFPEPSNGSLYMTYPHMQNGVAQHNALTRQLAQELDLPVIDLADTMPYGTQYWLDGLHMTAEGALEQATQYADFLIANNLLPQPR